MHVTVLKQICTRLLCKGIQYTKTHSLVATVHKLPSCKNCSWRQRRTRVHLALRFCTQRPLRAFGRVVNAPLRTRHGIIKWALTTWWMERGTACARQGKPRGYRLNHSTACPERAADCGYCVGCGVSGDQKDLEVERQIRRGRPCCTGGDRGLWGF